MTPTVKPYGTWRSPISAHMLVSGAVGISEVVPDGNRVWWAESRPDEGGRVAVMRWCDDNQAEITPKDANVRTTVHEYGGGAWWAQDDTLWYVDYSDQRLRQCQTGCDVEILSETPKLPRALRFADFRPTLCKHWLIGVAEQHTNDQSEPENYIFALATDGSQQLLKLASGNDFYGSPCISPDGSQLAWIEWAHPNMPWDSTYLWLADLATSPSGIQITNARRVAGSDQEAIQEPKWSPAGELHYLSDSNDLWSVYRLGQQSPVLALDGEIGYPPWVFGLARYAFKSTGEIVAARFKDGIDYLDGHSTDTAFYSVRISDDRLAYTSASWNRESSVFFDGLEVRQARDLKLDDAFLLAPEHLQFPTGTNGGDTAHALYYAPANPEFVAPDGEKPPLIVLAHGGPTAAARSKLSLDQRFWTSRGFAVADVNYRGSCGFGREYREKLKGQWGVADVEDCVAVAQYLCERGDVDPQRLIIRGGSAGGFTVLSALAFHKVFTAGTSLYGVADLGALLNDTHKFESRYLDSLIGPWPEAKALYEDRSPINHLEGFEAPMLVLQGSEDAIVPPNQSRMIVNALDHRGLPVAYLEFKGEQHGFRQAETIIKALSAELTFYGKIFGFTPFSGTIELKILNYSANTMRS